MNSINKKSLLPPSLVFFVSVIFLTIASKYLLLHHDIWWHIAAGDIIRETSKIPKHDVWSFSAGTQIWYNLSWLWDVIISLFHQFMGLEGLVKIHIFLIALGFSYICYFSASISFLAIPISIFALIAAFISILPDVPISVSPQTFSLLLFFPFFVLVRNFAHQENKLKAGVILVLIYVIWLNLHGGFLAAYTIFGAVFIQAMIQKQFAAAKSLVILVIICLAGSLLNPLGYEIFYGIESTLNHPAKLFVSEWQAFNFLKSPIAGVFVILGAVSIILPTTKLRNDHLLGLRILCLIWLLIGLKEGRHIALFIILSTPLITRASALVFSHKLSLPTRKNNHRLAVLLVVLSLGVHQLLWTKTFPTKFEIPENIYPVEEVEYLQSNFPPQPIYNNWNFGGYLIYKTRGEYPIFIDGRAGTAYPDWVFDQLTQSHNSELDLMESLYQSSGVKLGLARRFPPISELSRQNHPNWKLKHQGKVTEIWERDNDSSNINKY